MGAEDTYKAVWEAVRIQAPAHPLLLRWGSDDVWGFWTEADGDVGRDSRVGGRWGLPARIIEALLDDGVQVACDRQACWG